MANISIQTLTVCRIVRIQAGPTVLTIICIFAFISWAATTTTLKYQTKQLQPITMHGTDDTRRDTNTFAALFSNSTKTMVLKKIKASSDFFFNIHSKTTLKDQPRTTKHRLWRAKTHFSFHHNVKKCYKFDNECADECTAPLRALDSTSKDSHFLLQPHRFPIRKTPKITITKSAKIPQRATQIFSTTHAVEEGRRKQRVDHWMLTTDNKENAIDQGHNKSAAIRIQLHKLTEPKNRWMITSENENHFRQISCNNFK